MELGRLWRLVYVAIFPLVLTVLSTAQAQGVRVAVAANLQPTFEQLIQAFTRANPGVKVIASYGSSGAFAQQIVEGAPFDIFMSADVTFLQELQQRGLLEEGTLKIYAIGKLILFVPARVGLQATSLKVLSDPKIQRIIIANPQTAPYGRAAVQAMSKMGIYDQVKGKIAFGQNIAQAAQLTLAGGDAGLIAISAIYGPFISQGSWFMVPQNLYDPLEQAYAIVKGRARGEVKTLYSFLSSPQASQIYKAWGYGLPQP